MEQFADAAPRIVVIGGAAREVAAIVRTLPSRMGVALVIACTECAGLAEELRAVTALPTNEVRARARLESDQIYVLPEGEYAELEAGELVTFPANGENAILDRLLRTLAHGNGSRSAAVVLAGSGADGALGLKSLKEAGGFIIVQTPEDGVHFEMPRAAVATGLADVILAPHDIARRIATIAPMLGEQPLVEIGESSAAAETMRDILTLVRIRTGHDFASYKRATLFRRIARRMQVCGTKTLASYHQYLRERPGELGHLLRDFLISVTSFFRDPESFAVLANDFIPKLFANKTGSDHVRVWCAGCATGEEAYSLAMLLVEHASNLAEPPQIQVFATDIDEESLAEARAGRYPETISVDVNPERLARFFVREGAQFRVSQKLRERVLFSPHNVLRDPPFSRLDLICCRNLLIYLNRDAQERVFNVFHFGLRPDGQLFLGSSESSEQTGMFHPVDAKHRIFARRLVRNPLGFDALTVGARWHPPLATLAPSPDRDKSFGELHHKLVERYAPPSVLVNEELEVVHVSEHAGRYLEIGGGEPSRQLLRLVHPGLRLDLRGALFAARQKHSGDARLVRFDDSGVERTVELRVRLVDLPELGAGTLLVSFDEKTGTQEASEHARSEPPIEPLVREMENELLRTRDQLHTTVERYETSLEELRASNEELQAINEELRSATEELETSKEELQSVNEELTTLNHELKVMVEQVSHANSDLQNLMTSTDIGVMFLDRAIHIKRFTPRLKELFNLIDSDIGRPFAHVTHRLDANDLPDVATRVLGDLRPVEREVTSDDGRRYLGRFLPYRSVEDRIEGVVVTFVDVTMLREAVEARRRSEAALQASEERLRISLSNAPVIVIAFDPGGVPTWGYAYGKEHGGPRVLELLAPEDAARCSSIAREVATAKTSRRAELAIVLAPDTRHIYDFRFEPAAEGVTAVGFDITASKRAEAALLAADRRKDEFLATLSHELRNPLTPIKVALEIARVADDPVQRADSLAVMDRQVHQLSRLVDELLDLSKITEGKVTLHQALLDPAALVEAALETTRPLLDRHGHELHVALPTTTVRITGDRVRLTQVLVNLIENAAKYSPDRGRIEILVEADVARDLLRFRVRDSGVGIDADLLPHIFEIFVQGRDMPGRTQGLGIGLNLVRRIVDLHGGRVTASSAGKGRGSEFIVELPLAGASSSPDRRLTCALPRPVAALRAIVRHTPPTSARSRASPHPRRASRAWPRDRATRGRPPTARSRLASSGSRGWRAPIRRGRRSSGIAASARCRSPTSDRYIRGTRSQSAHRARRAAPDPSAARDRDAPREPRRAGLRPRRRAC